MPANRIRTAVYLLLLAAASVGTAADPIELFDGQSLAGWEGPEGWFRVESQSIVAGSLEKPIPHNMFLATEREFDDFELTLDAKLVGEGKNAGVQFRSQRIPNDHEVSGYQADIGQAWDRPVWGALYDESRRRKMLAEPEPETAKKALRPDDWNQLRVRAKGAHIQIWLNGVKTVDYQETDPQIERSGIIALQIHGGKPAEAHYRNIRLRPL